MDCGGFSICFHLQEKGGELVLFLKASRDAQLSVTRVLCVSSQVSVFCPSRPCPFKGAVWFGSLCRLIPCDKLLPALPSLSNRKLPRRPLVGDRRCRGLWETSGRLQAGRVGSGASFTSPTLLPYCYHSSSSTSIMCQYEPQLCFLHIASPSAFPNSS